MLHGIRRVYIAYDSDDAGNHAADALSKRLIAEEIECYRIRFPKGMDANEYALKVESAKEASVEAFHSEEYDTAVKNGTPVVELEKIIRFRKPTERELNLLYCDIHEREEKLQYTGNNQGDS